MQLSIVSRLFCALLWHKLYRYTDWLPYNKRESRRLDSLLTSLSDLDDGDGRHVVATLGLAQGELQLDTSGLVQRDGCGLRVTIETGCPCHTHLGQNGAAIVVAAVVLHERDNGKGLVLHSGEVERIDGDTVRERTDEVLGGNLLTVVLERGQQGGVHGGFTEVKHNFISFLCGRQACFIYQVQLTGPETELESRVNCAREDE